MPVKVGVCRLCHTQATLVAGPNNKTRVDLTVAARTGHQLFLADMARSLSLASARHRPPREVSPIDCARPVLRFVAATWWQPPLFDTAPDLRRVSSLDPPHDPGLAALMLTRAETMAGLRGWNARTLGQVRRGLRILAAAHRPGEPVKASTVHQLTLIGLSALRVHEVLTDLGLVVEDRPDSLQAFLDDRLAALPAQIRTEVHTWVGVLREGDGRRRPRARATITTRLHLIGSFLAACADSYATLRQVTRDDVIGWLAQQPARAQAGSALRSLFGVLKQHRLVFADPTRTVHTGQNKVTIPTPIPAPELRTTAEAARGDPALRVVVALAGIHALHPHQIRALKLDDVDLPNRRLRTGDEDRPLDEFTAAAVRGYLTYRHGRWPRTGNRHLLLTRRSAHGTDPVSQYWFNTLFRALPVTAARLREDRLIEEGVATGADPLHIATMFGLAARTGLRYATAAHDALAEHAGRSEPTHRPDGPPAPNP